MFKNLTRCELWHFLNLGSMDSRRVSRSPCRALHALPLPTVCSLCRVLQLQGTGHQGSPTKGSFPKWESCLLELYTVFILC